MSTDTKRRRVDEESKTRIVFDLADELSAEELERFERSAKEAGQDVTEFFLKLTLRKPTAA